MWRKLTSSLRSNKDNPEKDDAESTPRFRGKLGHYRGRPYNEWADKLEELRDKGREDDALAMATDLIQVVEHEALVEKWRPAPAYTLTAVDILQCQERHDEAITVLERYRDLVESLGFNLPPSIAGLLREARQLAEEGPVVENTDVCPACGGLMDPPIKRSGKCALCGTKVVARKYRGVTVLRTEAQQAEFAEKKDRADRLERIYVRANTIGVSDTEFDVHWQELSDKYGFTAAPGDVFWSLASNRKFARAQQPDPFGDLAIMCRMMAEHLHDEGRDWVPVSGEAVKHELKVLRMRDPGAKEVRPYGCNCDACQTNVEFVSIQAATRSPSIPHADCGRAPCKCYYSQV